MRSTPFLLAAAVVMFCTSGVAAQLERVVSERVAVHLLSSARQMSASPELNLLAIQTALILSRQATIVDPENADAWRFLVDMALLTEQEGYYEEAIRALEVLDPADDVVRLAGINLDLEKLNSLEERFVAYERLLDPARRDEIGPAVASRLALDVALLHQRRGDVDSFAKYLAEAVTIDPSHRAAMAIAAGFFRMNVDDPYAEAELLAGLTRADPTDITTLIALGELLLENGAYTGADRLYRVATVSMEVMDVFPRDQLLADACIAQWANGDGQAALRRIRRRQQQADEIVQNEVQKDDPLLNPLERAEFTGTIAPTLATVRAAIRVQRGDAEAAADVVRAVDAYDYVFGKAVGDLALAPDEEALMRLEMAWVAVWLGTDVERVEEILAEVEETMPLSDRTRARFDAWITLRRGETELALELLDACPDDDLAAIIGRAEAHKILGNRSETARALLAAARMRPGTLMGVWAANELWELLGARHPISPDAARLEGAISGLPSFFDRYPTAPSLAVDLQIVPARTVFGLYEPIVVNLHIRNNSPDPLAIDEDGPIRPELLLTFFSTMREMRRPELRPVIVDIGRRLRLEPREELVIPVNLRQGELGTVLSSNGAQGAFITVKATLNFRVTTRGAKTPALLGAEARTSQLRIEGVRVSPAYMQEALAAIEDPREIADLDRIAILIQATSYKLPANAKPELFQVFNIVRSATAQAYANLGGMSQAWVLSSTPTGRLSDQMRVWAQRSPDEQVRLLYLLFHLTGPDDPMLDPTLYPDSPHLRFLATQSTSFYETMRAQQRLRTTPGDQ